MSKSPKEKAIAVGSIAIQQTADKDAFTSRRRPDWLLYPATRRCKPVMGMYVANEGKTNPWVNEQKLKCTKAA